MHEPNYAAAPETQAHRESWQDTIAMPVMAEQLTHLVTRLRYPQI